jgi:DNA mismatch repair protein MutH
MEQLRNVVSVNRNPNLIEREKMQLKSSKRYTHKVEALRFLNETLLERNVKDFARFYETPIFLNGKTNKGWLGQTIERHLGLENNNQNKPDGYDFELKSTEVFLREGTWTAKETLKVTQLNTFDILKEEFESSVFWGKLKDVILVAYQKEGDAYICKKILEMKITDPDLVKEIRSFWEDVRDLVCSGQIREFINLGSSDSLIQLRPQGDGRQKSTCPITQEKFPARSFYATKKLINQMMNQN